MLEIGLMFYTKDLTKDIEKMIARYQQRLNVEPVTIWYKSATQPETLAGLKTRFTPIPDNHYIIAGKDATP